MTFDLPQILASKRAFRLQLAARDITVKLQMLDALRERALALRANRSSVGDSLKSRTEPDSHQTRLV